jgi:hypothetical protein
MSKILYSPLAILLSTVITILLCVSLYLNSHELAHSTTKITDLQAEVTTQNNTLEKLKSNLEDAKGDLAKEKIIRDQLLMQKPGEYVVQVPDLPVSSVPSREVIEPLSPWKKWQKLLF